MASNKQTMVLTEQDLHFVVENAVRAYLIENGMDEGFWGGLSTLGSKFGNGAKRMGQNMANTVGQAANAVGNKLGQAANAVGDKLGQAGQAMGKAYTNAKNTYQTGSANQDAQKAIQNAVNALNNLKAADQKLQSLGQYSVIGKQGALIDQLIATLSGGGARSISGRFQNRRNAFTR